MTGIKKIYTITYIMYFTYCKNHMVVAAIIELVLFSGCAHRKSPAMLGVPSVSPLDEARLAYEHGEYYKSRIQVQKILTRDPDNTAAQQLMGDVLEKEISRQKEAVLTTPDLSKEEANDANQVEIQNWLDRSRTLLHQKQYDLALFAAEKIFVYDANNREASLLIDDIKDEAIKNGKAESLFLSKMYREEISERVKKYRNEAEEMIQQNKSEQAQFVLQKILLLEPEDPEALRLFRDLKHKEIHA